MAEIEKLLDVIATLRDPHKGCPWDRVQNFSTIAPYTIEEAYEVADAISRDDTEGLRDELGDLLFQVVFHARMAEELGVFDFGDVVAAINDKMVRRHPHVFGTADEKRAGQQAGSWERIKAEERALNKDADSPHSVLDGVAVALPALTRAAKLGLRAARQGFDWPDRGGVQAKVAEELAELDEAVSLGSTDEIQDEFGDVMFSLVNLARHLNVDPEDALSHANRKFENRFREMERWLLSQGKTLADLPIDALEAAWQKAKIAQQNRP